MVFSPTWQRCRSRLCASEMVSGSMRAPSPVRNPPLKSAPQTRLGTSAVANDSLSGGTRRRCLRPTTRPSRAPHSPMALVNVFRPASFAGPASLGVPPRSATAAFMERDASLRPQSFSTIVVTLVFPPSLFFWRLPRGSRYNPSVRLETSVPGRTLRYSLDL